jgi:hypothetical protein
MTADELKRRAGELLPELLAHAPSAGKRAIAQLKL